MGKRMRYRFRVLNSLYPYTCGIRRYWGVLLLFSAVTVGLNFVTPVIYKTFINEVILRADLEKLGIIIIGYLAVYFAEVMTGYIKCLAKYTLVNRTTYEVRLKILRNFWNMKFSDYENVSVGDLKMRIDDDTAQVAEFVDNQTIGLLLQYITVMFSACMLFRISWELALFSIVAIPLTFWLDNLLSRNEQKLSNKRRENGQKTSSWLHASVQGWREIKALNLEKHEARCYYRFLHTDMLYNAKWINYWTARALIIPAIKDEFFMRFGLYFIGGLLIVSGSLNIGELLIFAVYYSLLSQAVQAVSWADANLTAQMPLVDRLLESLAGWKQEEVHESWDKKMPDESDTIVLKGVSFIYPDTEKAILEDFDLTIEKGERIAITGKSGSGKSTLLKLITGMLEPVKGTVSFSGINLRDIDISAMHSRIGYIMQQNILFNTSIRENLLFGKEDATEEELLDVCKKACIHDFVTELPDGLDTVIGEKGIKLSGGQRQRIVLARMFLQEIDVFILDEATSALDQYSESIVQDAICNIPKEKTIIVVAHRESSIKVCDRTVNIDIQPGSSPNWI